MAKISSLLNASVEDHPALGDIFVLDIKDLSEKLHCFEVDDSGHSVKVRLKQSTAKNLAKYILKQLEK